MASNGMLEAIGNTPLVWLRKIVPNGAAEVLVKLEYYNPTGSYKDRMARSMIAGRAAWRAQTGDDRGRVHRR